LHLAATTSKDLCQLLLAYSAEPSLHDVMGSNTLHYAATFKQNEVLEILLQSSQAYRLALEGDQKRVTPLHLTCALYSSPSDMHGPMLLLASGAKPWQADVSGTAARDVVPFAVNCELTKFFESHGDNSKAAAQAWLEELLLNTASDGSEATDEEEEDQESPTVEAVPSPTASRLDGAATERGSEIHMLREEVHRLQTSLEDCERRCEELEPLKMKLQHSQEKVEMLEQAAKNQQQIFQVQMDLMDQSRSQHQAQLQELKERHVADRQQWEDRSQADLEVRLRESQQEALAKLQQAELRIAELQAELQQAERKIQAEQEVSQEMQRQLNRTRSQELPTEPTDQQLVDASEMQELQSRVEHLEEVCQQEKAMSEETSRNLQDMVSATRRICAKYNIAWSMEENSSVNMLEGIEQGLSRAQGAVDEKEHERKALQQQVGQLKEEVEFLRGAKFEADDRCQQLQVELQQARNSVSAQALQLESQFRDSQMQHMQAVDQARGEAEAYQRRAKVAEGQLQSAQASADHFSAQYHQLEARFAEEQIIRKKYHNQIQDMKGNVRVFCRFRPLTKREEDLGDIPVLHKADAFSVDLHRLAPHNDTRRFDFDAVFGGDSPQEEVFGDCEDLVRSVVDGYNVTIFAYGQTGAGKTHTMYGTFDHPGLAPRAIDSLFHLIHREENQGRKTFTVKAYMIELYKQDILDLLAERREQTSKDQKQLQVKKDPGRGIMFVEGVCERHVHSPEQLKALLAEGERRRHTAATAMNTSSSRSHLMLSIVVEATAKETDQVIYGKITLCDLAGSERLKKSEVSGDALKEAIEINKSLTALGDVIEALSKGAKNIPYRNHKLTMLMQDSLGGSAKTLMFVNCSPASSNCEETLTSLKWATRAKQVTNDVKRNADCKEVARLKQVIAMMSQAQSAEEPQKEVASGMAF